MYLNPGDMPEFVDQFLRLLYFIFNPIVFLILLGILFIYIVYRVIKHFKNFYHISLRFKLPRALVDGVLGLLLILLLWDFYGQLISVNYGYDRRSVKISAIVEKLVEKSIKSDGKDEIFGISAEDWNKPFCIRYKKADIYEYCNYVNGIAVKDYYIYNGAKYDCPLYEKSLLKECSKLGIYYPENLGLFDRLTNHLSLFIKGEEVIRNEISVSLPIDILDTPKIFHTILKILNKPCNYIEKAESDKYYIPFFSKEKNDETFLYSINEKKEELRCDKEEKDNIKLYLNYWDNNKLKIQSTVLIKRED